MTSAVILFHIVNAVVGLLSGYLSLVFRKGSSLHRVAGGIFVVSMLNMTAAGAVIALFLRPNFGNVMGATITFYMVATAWIAGRRRERVVGTFDYVALFGALTIAVAGFRWGVQASQNPKGLHGYAPAMYFVFGTMALLFAASDLRMLVRGGVEGAQRLGRHLWRMGLALMMATMSLYPGQMKLFPKEIRGAHLFIPHLLLIAVIVFWKVRMARRRRAERQTPLVPSQTVQEVS